MASDIAQCSTCAGTSGIPEGQNQSRFLKIGLCLLIRFGSDVFLVGEIAQVQVYGGGSEDDICGNQGP